MATTLLKEELRSIWNGKVLIKWKTWVDEVTAKINQLFTAPTARSGAGAVPITSGTCLFTSSGTSQALTVADGTYAGQQLTIMHVVRGSGTGTGVITQTSGAKLTTAISTITLATLYASVTLEWSGALWNPVCNNGATIA